MTYTIKKPIREDDQVVVGKISSQNIAKYKDGNLINIQIGNHSKIFNTRDIFKTTPTPEVFNFPNNPMMMYTICISKVSQEDRKEKERSLLQEALL